MAPRVILWHRTDLRLHDAPALRAALDLKPEAFWPVWTWNPHYVHRQAVGPNRWQFLLDSMTAMSESYTAVNAKQKLHVVRGPPETLLPLLFKRWKITHLVYEYDPDPYACQRDEEIGSLAEEAGVEVIVKHGFTLYDPRVIVEKNKGKAPIAYGPFCKLVASIGDPAKPIDAPTELPDPGDTSLDEPDRAEHDVGPYRERDVNHASRKGDDHGFDTILGPNGDFSVPTMEELNMEEATSTIRGGEKLALESLDSYLEDKKAVVNFEKPKTNPAAFDPPSTTQLSPHLKFGTLSCRLFYWRLREVIDGSKHTEPPVSLIGQLLFREQFNTLMSMNRKWRQMLDNPMCRFYDWRLANEYDDDGELKQRESDPEAEEFLKKWSEGQTGFPWIDALMRQLKETGWIHHLGRHSVACFLTRGHCYISWERGEGPSELPEHPLTLTEVFARHLVDWNSAMNVANWMWLSASQFFHQYYRVYSPIAFGKKHDPSGKLIRKFCPELADFPDKYIYEPWKAPEAVQKKAKCIIGKDYPEPMLDEKAAKEDTLARVKAAYDLKIMGDDPSALDGSARAKLRAARKDNIDGDDVPDQDGTEESAPGAKPSHSDTPAPAEPKRKRASGQSHDKRKTKQTKCVRAVETQD